MVGISGFMRVRCVVETASARSLPSLMSPAVEPNGAMKKCTRPVMTSVSASGMPLWGTCTTSMPALLRIISPPKCVALPVPAEVKLSCPGFALASATRSLTERTSSELGTTR